MTQTTRRTFTQSIHHAFIFPTPAGSRTFAFGSLLATVTGLFPACDPATAPSADDPRIDSIEQGVIAYGQADWVQLRGRRDTSQVQYYKEFWRDSSGCNSRFGCRSMTVF
ncbi:MAG TPA: hypothetical protein PKW11_14900, partial [Pseudomonadota bacterium]|nr:hypothetical protein [Pseudomonadota bacterium]